MTILDTIKTRYTERKYEKRSVFTLLYYHRRLRSGKFIVVSTFFANARRAGKSGGTRAMLSEMKEDLAIQV